MRLFLREFFQMENEGDFILVDNFRWGFHRKSAISWERHVQLWSGIPR